MSGSQRRRKARQNRLLELKEISENPAITVTPNVVYSNFGVTTNPLNHTLEEYEEKGEAFMMQQMQAHVNAYHAARGTKPGTLVPMMTNIKFKKK